MNSYRLKTNPNVSTRLHPLVAAAAVSLIVVSLLGAAALAGLLPNSRADVPPTLTASEQAKLTQSSAAAAPQKHPNRPVTQVASASNAPAPAPAQQAAPAKQNSAVGMGIGAVVGGLLGNQVGSGDGKTLATVAGAVGGAYVGNEIAKKNQ